MRRRQQLQFIKKPNKNKAQSLLSHAAFDPSAQTNKSNFFITSSTAVLHTDGSSAAPVSDAKPHGISQLHPQSHSARTKVQINDTVDFRNEGGLSIKQGLSNAGSPQVSFQTDNIVVRDKRINFTEVLDTTVPRIGVSLDKRSVLFNPGCPSSSQHSGVQEAGANQGGAKQACEWKLVGNLVGLPLKKGSLVKGSKGGLSEVLKCGDQDDCLVVNNGSIEWSPMTIQNVRIQLQNAIILSGQRLHDSRGGGVSAIIGNGLGGISTTSANLATSTPDEGCGDACVSTKSCNVAAVINYSDTSSLTPGTNIITMNTSTPLKDCVLTESRHFDIKDTDGQYLGFRESGMYIVAYCLRVDRIVQWSASLRVYDFHDKLLKTFKCSSIGNEIVCSSALEMNDGDRLQLVVECDTTAMVSRHTTLYVGKMHNINDF